MKKFFDEWKIVFGVVIFLIGCHLLFPETKVFRDLNALEFIPIWIIVIILLRLLKKFWKSWN